MVRILILSVWFCVGASAAAQSGDAAWARWGPWVGHREVNIRSIFGTVIATSQGVSKGTKCSTALEPCGTVAEYHSASPWRSLVG